MSTETSTSRHASSTTALSVAQYEARGGWETPLIELDAMVDHLVRDGARREDLSITLTVSGRIHSTDCICDRCEDTRLDELERIVAMGEDL